MGPLEFICYTDEVTDVISSYRADCHLYADDSQLYASCLPRDASSIQQRLTDCTSDVATWCASRRLQLNVDKTEAIWFGSRVNLNKLDTNHKTMTLGTEHVEAVSVVRDLGVLLDSELSMKQHIAKLSSVCFMHLRRIRQLRRRVGCDISTRLVLALVTSRLDYCNSILAGLPANTIRPLQRVQNAAVRLIFELKPYDHVTPGLIQLHWLPIQYRITYKLCVLMFAIHTRQSPTYTANLVCASSSRSSRYELRSSDSLDYIKPRLHSKIGERAFSYAGPAAWNALPTFIRTQSTFFGFKRALKTYLFRAAFDIHV